MLDFPVLKMIENTAVNILRPFFSCTCMSVLKVNTGGGIAGL